jgi:hypothetical protein
MKKLATTLSMMLAATALTASVALAQVTLNEIRVDQTGTDVDEYVEFAGAPGTALTGLTLVVIGDGGGACGTVENVIPLGAYSIQADGYFALRVSSGTPTLTGYDATVAGSFENSDDLTFLLITGSAPAVAADLDTNNDGVLDVTPWTSIVDHVAITEGLTPNCTTDEYNYSTTDVGPDGSFAPGHIYKCGSVWVIGPFDPLGGLDTVGAANNCATPTNPSTWGKIKSIYR